MECLVKFLVINWWMDVKDTGSGIKLPDSGDMVTTNLAPLIVSGSRNHKPQRMGIATES